MTGILANCRIVGHECPVVAINAVSETFDDPEPWLVGVLNYAELVPSKRC